MTDWLREAREALLQVESRRDTIEQDLFLGAADEARIQVLTEFAVKAADEIILLGDGVEEIDVTTIRVVNKILEKTIMSIENKVRAQRLRERIEGRKT